jgi:hypothetical protein
MLFSTEIRGMFLLLEAASKKFFYLMVPFLTSLWVLLTTISPVYIATSPFVKSLLTSLFQMEVRPSLAAGPEGKEG